MITLMVNFYAEDPQPAIDSVLEHLGGDLIDRVVALDGRYDGFAKLDERDDAPFPSEHAKRNAMLRLAGDPDPDRWLLWIDCDERIIYASPALTLQLARSEVDVAAVKFIEPLDPNMPGLEDLRRGVRDHRMWLPRLIRHLPGLEYRHRHDYLLDGEGRVLIGWPPEDPIRPTEVDVVMLHDGYQTPERVIAKHDYYQGPIRQAEVDASPHRLSGC